MGQFPELGTKLYSTCLLITVQLILLMSIIVPIQTYYPLLSIEPAIHSFFVTSFAFVQQIVE